MRAKSVILATAGLCLLAAGAPVRAADADLIESCDAAGETTALRRYICAQPDLRAEIAAIARRYSQITRNADKDVRILAHWDFHFFRIALSSCATLKNMDVCAHSRITHKGRLLSLPVSPARLAAAIKQNGILDPDLIARYPAAFVNVEAAFPGQAKLGGRLHGDPARHPQARLPVEAGGAPPHQAELGGGLSRRYGIASAGSLPVRNGGAPPHQAQLVTGRFISDSGKSYPMVAPQGISASHGESGWFRGHMELRGKSLIMVLQNE